MFHNKKGNSIIEVMVVIIILTSGIVGTYNILDSGQKLSSGSANRIMAINIAREGMEAVENIRDTNWIKFSSDYDNCWKVKDYNVNCIGDVTGNKNFSTGSYMLAQSGTLWMLSATIAPSSITTNYSGYLQQFPVFLDKDGLITNSGSNTRCTSSVNTNCRTIFTREIRIENPDVDHMKVNSIITWADNSKTSGGPHIINLETTLTNWRKKF